MRTLVSSIAAVAALVAANGASAGVHVQVWFVSDYMNPTTSDQLQADAGGLATLAGQSYTTASFDYSGPIDWQNNMSQGSSNLLNQFLDTSDISNLSSSDFANVADLGNQDLSQPGTHLQTFFQVMGSYTASYAATGSILHDDGASVYFNGSNTAAYTQPGWTSASPGTFTTPAASPGAFTVDYVEANGTPSDLVFSLGLPEPATWAMMLLGVGGIGAIARQRRALSGAVA